MSTEAFSVERTVPILRIFDVAKAKEFYVDYLGFQVDWEHRFDDDSPLYLQVSLGPLVLHLSEHYGDACPGSAVRVEVKGVRELHRKVSEKRYRYYRPGIEETPWGSRCVSFLDPFGNRLHFDEAGATSE